MAALPRQPTMKELNRAYDAAPGNFTTEGSLKHELFHLLSAAHENADDSGADFTDGEWDDLAVRSLCSHLCDRSTSDEARAFFTAQGVKF